MSDNYDEALDVILNDISVKGLVDEVKSLYDGKELIVKLDVNLDSHGAFDWQKPDPTILINPNTGLSIANICHELIHAVQYKNGFPIIRNDLYKDKRTKVATELLSNILHIQLAHEFDKRGISVKEYFHPTISTIKNVLKKRKKKDIKELPVLRIQYDAIVYLRIFYEAKYLTPQEKKYIGDTFKKYSPTAYDLAKELKVIIDKNNNLTPDGSAKSICNCFEHLNGNNASSKRSDFVVNLYSNSVKEINDNYSF